MRAHTHTHVCTHTCMHTRMHTHVCAHTLACTHACTRARMHSQTHARTHACTDTHACTHTWTHMQAHMHRCMHAHTHTHAHTCTHACRWGVSHRLANTFIDQETDKVFRSKVRCSELDLDDECPRALLEARAEGASPLWKGVHASTRPGRGLRLCLRKSSRLQRKAKLQGCCPTMCRWSGAPPHWMACLFCVSGEQESHGFSVCGMEWVTAGWPL